MAKLLLFSRRIEEVSIFINMVCLYLSMKITEESKVIKMA